MCRRHDWANLDLTCNRRSATNWRDNTNIEHFSSRSSIPKPPSIISDISMNFNSRRVKYLELVLYRNNKNLTSQIGAFRIQWCTCPQTRVIWTFQSVRRERELRPYNRPSRKWDAITETLKRFCGMFTGIKSSIHTQRPVVASIFSWSTQRLMAPNVG